MKKAASPQPPSEEDVLRRMLNTPPKPHDESKRNDPSDGRSMRSPPAEEKKTGQ